MVVESRNKNVPIFVLDGVSHRRTRSTKVYFNREGETLELKKRSVGGVMNLGSRGFVAEPISTSTPQKSYVVKRVNENSQNTMKETKAR